MLLLVQRPPFENHFPRVLFLSARLKLCFGHVCLLAHDERKERDTHHFYSHSVDENLYLLILKEAEKFSLAGQICDQLATLYNIEETENGFGVKLVASATDTRAKMSQENAWDFLGSVHFGRVIAYLENNSRYKA